MKLINNLINNFNLVTYVEICYQIAFLINHTTKSHKKIFYFYMGLKQHNYKLWMNHYFFGHKILEVAETHFATLVVKHRDNGFNGCDILRLCQ